MNDPILAEPEPNLLEQLLASHFSRDALARLLGPEAAELSEPIWRRALTGPVSDFVERPGKALRAGLLARCYEALLGPAGSNARPGTA